MIIEDLNQVNQENAGVMAFGFFDSIHLGHREVIRSAVHLAKEMGTISSVFLFKNNIYPLLGIEKSPIYSFEERINLIRTLGVDAIYYVDADQEFLSLSPEDFLSDLQSKLDIKGFACGRDFTFGHMGKGTVNDLIRLLKVDHCVVDLLEIDADKVSSERVRSALRMGDLPLVKRFLGRDFAIERPVLRGRTDGGKMGFPTINVDLLSVPLCEGVYFTDVIVDCVRYQAVTNVGSHPTFSDMRVNIESHLLSF